MFYIIQSPLQKWITSMAWRPYSSELAVGCQKGLSIWFYGNADNNWQLTRSGSQVVFLKQ